jgi:hypothetical protein
MMDFLVFPDNKLEYIPALFIFLLFIIATFAILRMFIVVSKKEEKRLEDIEKIRNHLKT